MRNTVICADNSPLWRKGAVGVTMYPVIFVKKSYWNSLDAIHKAVLMEHESIHLNQQRKSLFTYAHKYAKDKNFRLRVEVEAYGAEVRHDAATKVPKATTLNTLATILCSGTYSNMCSYATAVATLKSYYANLR